MCAVNSPCKGHALAPPAFLSGGTRAHPQLPLAHREPFGSMGAYRPKSCLLFAAFTLLYSGVYVLFSYLLESFPMICHFSWHLPEVLLLLCHCISLALSISVSALSLQHKMPQLALLGRLSKALDFSSSSERPGAVFLSGRYTFPLQSSCYPLSVNQGEIPLLFYSHALIYFAKAFLCSKR